MATERCSILVMRIICWVFGRMALDNSIKVRMLNHILCTDGMTLGERERESLRKRERERERVSTLGPEKICRVR